MNLFNMTNLWKPGIILLLKGILSLIHVDQWQSFIAQHSAHAKGCILLKGHTSDFIFISLALSGGGGRLHESLILAFDLLFVDAISASHLRVIAHLHRSRNDYQGNHADDEEPSRYDYGDQQLHSRLFQIKTRHHEERIVLDNISRE